MGSRQAVVINGYTLIKESLERKDDVFSDRPNFYTAEVLKKAFNGYHSIEFCPFNQLYIQRRKMMVRALHRFTHINIDYTHDLIQEEAVFMIDMFLSWKGAPHYIDEEMNATVGSILYQLLFGRGQRIREDILFQRIMRACDAYVNFTESGNPCEVIPWLRFFMRAKSSKLLQLFKMTVDCILPHVTRHSATVDRNHIRDITDILLLSDVLEEADGETSTAKRNSLLLPILTGLLGAGLETTKTTMMWLLTYMVLYPEVQKRIQEEIDKVAGGRPVNLNDKAILSYTEATIFEIMRIVGIVPFALPHCSLKDTKLNGFDIDKGTVILVNLHSVNMDESLWESPDKFLPERFLDSNNELDVTKSSRVIAFGLGRRRCLGEYLANTGLFVLFSNVLQRCTFKTGETQSIDMAPKPGLTHRLKPVKYVIQER